VIVLIRNRVEVAISVAKKDILLEIVQKRAVKVVIAEDMVAEELVTSAVKKDTWLEIVQKKVGVVMAEDMVAEELVINAVKKDTLLEIAGKMRMKLQEKMADMAVEIGMVHVNKLFI
jgi:hypothetical protein